MKITSKFTLIGSLFCAIGFVFAADHPAAVMSADDALAKLKEGERALCQR